jgi:hypothetical protein
LARIFPEIHLDIRDSALAERVGGIITSVHPQALIRDVQAATLVISVGQPMPGAYFADASGWQLHVASPGQDQRLLGQAGRANPASALLAATLVAARVLSNIPGILDTRPARGATSLNLWHPDLNKDGPEIPAQLQLDTHIFGHGSISNALWGALAEWPLAGFVTAVDDDAYETHNPARYTFLPSSKVGAHKVDELHDLLAPHTALNVKPCPETIQAWSRRPGPPPRLAIISPDNRLARAWAADTQLVLAVAASASDREAQVAYCNTDEGICSYCLFAPGHVTPTSQRDAIAAFTGLSLGDVVAFTREWNGQPPLPLNEAAVRIIETKMGKGKGSFDHWIGRLLLDFLHVHQAALYSAAVVRSTGADRIHLPLPLASAAAGALALAGLLRMTLEGFEQRNAGFNHLRLNVWTGEIQYILESPPDSLTCLCQNAFRRAWRSPPAGGVETPAKPKP